MTTISVVIGRFGAPNRNGDVFIMDEAALRERLDKMVGKVVGETSQNAITSELKGMPDLSSRLNRIERVDALKSAGTLMGYQIGRFAGGELIVMGDVEPSPLLLNLLEHNPTPAFGIRCLTQPRSPTENKIQVMNLISFDYLPPTER